MKLRLLMIAMIVCIAPSLYADSIYSDTFQGLTFKFTQTDADTLKFEIDGTPSGDWSSAQYLSAFSLKDLGINFGTATGTANGPGAVDLVGLNKELSANGQNPVDCSGNGGGPDVACWDVSPDAGKGVSGFDLTYIIDFSAPLDITDPDGPHLKIAFTDTLNGKKIGSLYSENVPFVSSSGTASSGTGSSGAVPEPATGSLVLIGLGLIGAGFGFRRRSCR